MIGLASWGQTDTLVWDSPLLSVGGGEGEKDKCLSTMINSSHSHATARRHPAHCAWDIDQLRLVCTNKHAWAAERPRRCDIQKFIPELSAPAPPSERPSRTYIRDPRRGGESETLNMITQYSKSLFSFVGVKPDVGPRHATKSGRRSTKPSHFPIGRLAVAEIWIGHLWPLNEKERQDLTALEVWPACPSGQVPPAAQVAGTPKFQPE